MKHRNTYVVTAVTLWMFSIRSGGKVKIYDVFERVNGISVINEPLARIVELVERGAASRENTELVLRRREKLGNAATEIVEVGISQMHVTSLVNTASTEPLQLLDLSQPNAKR